MAEEKKRANYLHVNQYFRLNQACRAVSDAYQAMPYLVGSCLSTPAWRDVDIRLILNDEEFQTLFPKIGKHRDTDPRWMLQCRAISAWLATQSGLPVDFQIQSMTEAAEYPGSLGRSAIGYVMDWRELTNG